MYSSLPGIVGGATAEAMGINRFNEEITRIDIRRNGVYFDFSFIELADFIAFPSFIGR